MQESISDIPSVAKYFAIKGEKEMKTVVERVKVVGHSTGGGDDLEDDTNATTWGVLLEQEEVNANLQRLVPQPGAECTVYTAHSRQAGRQQEPANVLSWLLQ